jgi:hypothetical protein
LFRFGVVVIIIINVIIIIIIIIIIITTTTTIIITTAIGLSPVGSSPTLVQTKIKIHKQPNNYNNKTTTKHKKHKTTK